MPGWLLAAVVLAGATPAMAQQASGSGDHDLRFCPNRPSIEESPCTIDPGHVMLEASAFDWTRDDQPGSREDRILAGDMQLRFGLTHDSELQLNWTAYGHDRTRDKATGAIDQASGVGDVRLSYRKNLSHPDAATGFSIALEPYVTLPTGGRAIGAGTWGAGGVVPALYNVTQKFNLEFTGSLAAVPNASRTGRHFAYAGDFGFGYQLTPKLQFVGEVQITADQDPGGRTTQSVAAGSLAYMVKKHLQFDVLIGAGLNRDTPDLRVITGGAVLF